MSAPSIPSKSTICELCSDLRSSQRAAGSKWPKSLGTTLLETPVLAHIHPSPKLRSGDLGSLHVSDPSVLKPRFIFFSPVAFGGFAFPNLVIWLPTIYTKLFPTLAAMWLPRYFELARESRENSTASVFGPFESSDRQDLALGMCISNSGEVLERGPSPDPFNFLSTYWGSICYS